MTARPSDAGRYVALVDAAEDRGLDLTVPADPDLGALMAEARRLDDAALAELIDTLTRNRPPGS